MEKEFKPFEVIEGDINSGVILLCDHARNSLPEVYGTLGLPESEFGRHIAYDIGTEALTRELSRRLNAPAVYSCFSRLLIDPNRGRDDPTIVMRLSDGTVIPGNYPITQREINHRIESFHQPYHLAIDALIDDCIAGGVNPMVFSIHSFTPYWKSVARTWEAAILWDSDPRLPKFVLNELRQLFDYRDDVPIDQLIGDNQPYDGALKNDTMYQHCTKRGLAHALLEVRQDLIEDAQGVTVWADRLEPILRSANMMHEMHDIRMFPSRID